MKTFKHKPTLTIDNIVLRPFVADDYIRMHEIVSHPDVIHLTGAAINSQQLTETMSLDRIKQWYDQINEQEDRLDLAITVDNRVVGEVVFNEWDEDMMSCNFRVLIDPNEASKGVGSKAISLFLDYGLNELNLHRIELEVFSFNPRARHVYEKVGFTYEGTKREAFRFDNIWHDIHFYAMINENDLIK